MPLYIYIFFMFRDKFNEVKVIMFTSSVIYIRKWAIFSLQITINYNQSICCRWADLSSSLTWPAWLSALHLGPAPSYVAPAFFRIGYQSSSLSLLWQSYSENIEITIHPKVFVDGQALRRGLSQQLSQTNWLRCQVSKRCRSCWNVISFRDLDNSHDVVEIFLTTFEISSVLETWTILMIALASSTFRLLTLSWGYDLEFHLDSFSFMKSFIVPKTWEYLKWKGSTTSHRQLHSTADGLCSQSCTARLSSFHPTYLQMGPQWSRRCGTRPWCCRACFLSTWGSHQTNCSGGAAPK